MRKPLLAGVLTASVLMTGVVADRVTAFAVAGRLAERLRCAAGLPSTPSVTVGGFPFLSQLAAGRFDSIRITAGDVPAGRFRADVEATATGVRLPRGGAVRADSLTATVTVGYDLVRTVPGGALGEISADGSGHLLVSATRTVFGRKVPVTVIATPEITGDELTLHPVEVEVPSAGLRLPSSRFAALRQLPSTDLPDLPAGLSWTAVTASPDGLRLSVEGAGLSAAAASGDGAPGRCGSSGATA